MDYTTEIINQFESIGIKYLTLNWSESPKCILFNQNDEIASRILNFVEDSELLLSKLCLLFEDMLASTLVQFASKLPEISKSCSKFLFSDKIFCNSE